MRFIYAHFTLVYILGLAVLLSGCTSKNENSESGEKAATSALTSNEARAVSEMDEKIKDPSNIPTGDTSAAATSLSDTKNPTTLPGLPDLTDSALPEDEVAIPSPLELKESLDEFIQAVGNVPEFDKMDEPQKLIFYFVRAIQTQDEQAIIAMLTSSARLQRAKMNFQLGGKHPQDAEVELKLADYLKDDEGNIVGARVGTTWVTVDADGMEYEDNIVWVLRKEPEGWRVAGMVGIIDPKYPPITVDFEDLEESLKMAEKLQIEYEKKISENKLDK